MDKLLLTPIETARVLGIGRSKLYQLLQDGQLDSVHIGSCRRIPLPAIHTFLAALNAGGATAGRSPSHAAPATLTEDRQELVRPR